MKFTDTLKELEAKATEGPLVVIDCRPDRDLITLTDGASVFCRIENRVALRPLDSEDEANARLIAYLRNHSKEIIALVEAAENAMLVYQTNAQNYPIAVAMEKMREALAALNKEQS